LPWPTPEDDAEVRRARKAVVTLRLFGLVDAAARPKQLADAARTLLGAWRNRTREKPAAVWWASRGE